MIQTEKAGRIRDYYLSLEQILIDYLRYSSIVNLHNESIKTNQLKQEIEQYKIQMDRLKINQNEMDQLIIDTTPVELTEYVYILTSKRYYPLNLFKIGKTIHLKNRLCTYNTGNALDDDTQFYLCSIKTSDSNGLEKQLHRLLKNFLYRKEWYKIHTSDLLKLVKFLTNQQEATKVFIDELISNQLSIKTNIELEEFLFQTNIEIVEQIGYYTKDNKFFCNLCNKDYLKLGGMMNHINNKLCKESKIGSYKCPQCSKIFTIHHYYQQHIDKDNCAPKTYTCEGCDKTYSAKKHYDNHILKGCIDRFKCDRCLKSFPNNWALIKHINRKIPCNSQQSNQIDKDKIRQQQKEYRERKKQLEADLEYEV